MNYLYLLTNNRRPGPAGQTVHPKRGGARRVTGGNHVAL
jgi:hypothetical protein